MCRLEVHVARRHAIEDRAGGVSAQCRVLVLRIGQAQSKIAGLARAMPPALAQSAHCGQEIPADARDAVQLGVPLALNIESRRI